MDVDVDLGGRVHDFVDDTRQHVATHTVAGEHPQRPPLARFEMGQGRVQLAKLHQGILRGFGEARAVDGKTQAAALVHDELHARLALDRPQRLADGRMAEEELFGDLRKGLPGMDADEHLKLGGVEHCEKPGTLLPAICS